MEKTLKEEPTIKIDKEGNWFFKNLPIINRKIFLFFNQQLRKDEKGGYVLRVGQETCKIKVEDTPFVVAGIEFVDSAPGKESFFKIRVNDETEETLDLNSLYIDRDNVPYCLVKRERYPARFLRPPYYHLAEFIQQEKEGRFFILLNKKKLFIKFNH
ncbi:MAG: DUF1285 domain-containing protein [Alphaproteobacteria bacterium]